jgi:uncharacterized protein (DUF983 family)
MTRLAVTGVHPYARRGWPRDARHGGVPGLPSVDAIRTPDERVIVIGGRHMVVTPQRPRLRSILRQRCPGCGEGQVFRGAFRMNECCPACGYQFERAPGFYLGAMLFGYAIDFPILAATILLGHWLLPAWPLPWLTLAACVCGTAPGAAGSARQRSRLDPVPENPMYQLFLIFALPLTLFFLVTFFFTWWIRGRGFGELIGLVRPARRQPGSSGAGRAHGERAGD